MKLFGMDIGKEAQTTHVHSNDGNLLAAYAACRLEKRAVASHGYDKVSIEVPVAKNMVDRHGKATSIDEEAVELAVNVHFRPALLERGDDIVDEGRLLDLVSVAENGEF